MKPLGQFAIGIGAALGTTLLVIAALLLSLTEGGQQVAEVIFTATLPPTSTQPPASTPGASQTVLPSSTASLTPSITVTLPSLCPRPRGWVEYTIETGDTLESLAQRSGVSVTQLMKANCLLNTELMPGTILYLPGATLTPTRATATRTATFTATAVSTITFTPTASKTPIPCGPPPGWRLYTVKAGDTLYRISVAYRVTVGELMFANCLGSTLIRPGMLIYVPNVATSTPVVTKTPTPKATFTPSPTETITISPVISDTPTSTPVPSDTVTPTSTPTPTDTPTLTPTLTTAAPVYP